MILVIINKQACVCGGVCVCVWKRVIWYDNTSIPQMSTLEPPRIYPTE